MMQQTTFIQSEAEFLKWRAARLDGTIHFYIPMPDAFPCIIVWIWCNELLHFTYIYKIPTE